MDLNLNPQETKFRDELRAWLKANIPSDWETHRLHDSMEDRFRFLRAWQKRVYEAGWAGVAWPKEYGGRGGGAVGEGVFSGEMGRAGGPAPADGLGLAPIRRAGFFFRHARLKTRYLARI